MSVQIHGGEFWLTAGRKRFILKMDAPNVPNPANPNAQDPDQNQDQDQDQDQVPAGQVPAHVPTQPVPEPVPAQLAPAGVILKFSIKIG